MRSRRAQPRKTVLTRITAVCDGQDGPAVIQRGLLENRSLAGVAISVPNRIAIGTKVKIRGTKRELAGVVRNCRLEGPRYLVGVALDQEDVDWDGFGPGL